MTWACKTVMCEMKNAKMWMLNCAGNAWGVTRQKPEISKPGTLKTGNEKTGNVKIGTRWHDSFAKTCYKTVGNQTILNVTLSVGVWEEVSSRNYSGFFPSWGIKQVSNGPNGENNLFSCFMHQYLKNGRRYIYCSKLLLMTNTNKSLICCRFFSLRGFIRALL